MLHLNILCFLSFFFYLQMLLTFFNIFSNLNFFQIGRILSKLWPLLTGTPGLPTTATSLKDLAHLAPVLEQLVTGKADEETWDK